MLRIQLSKLKHGINVVRISYYVILFLKRIVFLTSLKSYRIIFSFNIKLLSNWEILSNAWRKNRFFHKLFKMLLHFLLFFSEIRITFSSLRLPASEVPTKLPLIIEFALINIQDVRPLLILLFFLVFELVGCKIQLF